MMAGYNHFPLIASRVKPACKRVVRETAKDIQGMAVAQAPRETGWLEHSIYVATTSGVKYPNVTVTATGYQLQSKDLFPPEMPDDDLTALVGVGATYGIYVEMGTRFMPAQPYFYPAVEWARAYFMHALDLEGLLAVGVTGSLGVETI